MNSWIHLNTWKPYFRIDLFLEMYVFKLCLNMIPMAVAGVQVKSHEKSRFARDVNPLRLSPILRNSKSNHLN